MDFNGVHSPKLESVSVGFHLDREYGCVYTELSVKRKTLALNNDARSPSG